MKKIISTTLLLSIFAFNVSAKKVKFAVDMTGQIINTTGIHVSGDFQTIAGFPGGDWASNTTTLTQEGTTDIYSIVVDLPAFAKYEYKFLNGDQFYEAEFVPIESRVGYNFNDNRWVYVDSLGDDTTFVGAIVFAANAPAGNFLVRYLVDTQTLPSIDVAGMHLAGSFQNWDPTTTFLYSFTSNVYEIISYVPTGTYEFKFYNGNVTGTEEIIPGICSVNSNREITVDKDTVLTSFCFASCTACLVGIEESEKLAGVELSPNPAADYTMITFKDNNLSYTISIFDITGRKVDSYFSDNKNTVRIETEQFTKGIYFVNAIADNNKTYSGKLIIN